MGAGWLSIALLTSLKTPTIQRNWFGCSLHAKVTSFHPPGQACPPGIRCEDCKVKEPQNEPWTVFCLFVCLNKLSIFFWFLCSQGFPKGEKKTQEPEHKEHWIIFTITLLEFKEN